MELPPDLRRQRLMELPPALPPAPQPDPTQGRIVLLVVLMLGGASLLLIVLVGMLAFAEKEIPGEIWPLLGGTVGALSALLVSTRTSTTPGGTPPP